MRDPFPIPPSRWLAELVTPLSERLALATLPLHIHEIVFFFGLYTFVQVAVSPRLSRALFPRHYGKLSRRTRINWDVHVVSFVQSVLVCALALYVAAADDERTRMNSPPPGKGLLDRWWKGGHEERVWGYTGALGLVQAAACGYFLWDLVVSVMYINVFGFGLLAHAISALVVFALGFRPFVNYYGPTFILYELSSPFLNIHWFCDKLDMTGSTTQLLNGFVLLGSFFGSRLVWGTWQSLCVFVDVLRTARSAGLSWELGAHAGVRNFTVAAPPPASAPPHAPWDTHVLAFANPAGPTRNAVPVWLAASYLSANLVLNGLNWFWFGKMIETIRKRFPPPLGTMRVDKKRDPPALEKKTPVAVARETTLNRALHADGHTSLELDSVEVKRVNKPRTLGVPPRADDGASSEEDIVMVP